MKTPREIIEEQPAIEVNSTPVQEPEKTEEQKPEKKAQEIQAIAIDENGLVKAKNNSELIRYCKAVITSEMVPERFNTPEKLFGALMFSRSLNLPDIAIRQVAVIEGTPSLFGDLPLALIQKDGQLKNFKEVWFDKEYKEIRFENKNLDAEVFGAVCFASRGEGEIQSFSYTMKDAEKAGQYPAKKRDGSINNFSPWMKHTKMMLRYKARAIMAKSLFADKINGVSISEYDFDQTLDSVKDVTPKGQSNLKNTFEDEGQTQGE